VSWGDFERAAPELAGFGAVRLNGQVAYLATTRSDGSPRVHPVTPIIGEGHFFLFMEPTSPKAKDLQRDGRYQIHCGMSDSSGQSGEFWCAGRARLLDDATLRALAAQIGYPPKPHYILFELDVERAQSTVYAENIVRTRWKMDRE
jgi:hypothetical protein